MVGESGSGETGGFLKDFCTQNSHNYRFKFQYTQREYTLYCHELCNLHTVMCNLYLKITEHSIL